MLRTKLARVALALPLIFGTPLLDRCTPVPEPKCASGYCELTDIRQLNNGISLVEIWQAYCPYCEKTDKMIKELKPQLEKAGVRVFVLNREIIFKSYQDLIDQVEFGHVLPSSGYAMRNSPVIILFRDGKKILIRNGGYSSLNDFRSEIEKALGITL